MEAFKMGQSQYPVALDIDREAISKLPGFGTKVYDDMMEQADSSSKLNLALALMRTGFAAAGASAKPGESPISTLSRTLLSPLSEAAGKTMAASKKEKMAARLGKLQAEGRISSTAYSAAVARQAAGQATTDKLILETLKSKKPVAPSITDVGPGFSINVGTKDKPILQEVEARVFTPKGGGKPFVQLSSDVIGGDGKVLATAGKNLSQGKGPLQFTYVDTSKKGAAKPVNFEYVELLRDVVGLNETGTGKKGQIVKVTRLNGQVLSPLLGNRVLTAKDAISAPAPSSAGSGGDPVNALQDEKWKVFSKTIQGQIAPIIENIDSVEKKLGFRGGKFTYFDAAGEEIDFDAAAQPYFKQLLEDKICAEHPKFGGVEQKGSDQSKNFLTKAVKDFFRTNPKTLLDNMLSLKIPQGARVYPTSTALTKIMQEKIGQAKNDNEKPFSEIAAGILPDKGLSRKPVGLFIDGLNTDPLLWGPETTGTNFKPTKNSSNRIGNRLITERLMKNIPKNQTSAADPKLATASSRYSVLEKRRGKKLEEVSKKLSSADSLKKQKTYNDLIRSVRLIDSYNKAQVIGEVEGFIKGGLISGTQKIGLNPQAWWTTPAGVEAKKEAIAIRGILEQISARGVLSATGEKRFTDKDLKGAQKLFGSMNNDKGYNATALKQIRGILMGGVRSMLGQTGSFKISDEMIEQGLKLGAKPSDIIVNRSDQGGYSKYYQKKDRAYEVSKQFAPGASSEDFTKLEQIGVLEPFKAPGGDYQVYKTQEVTDANGNVSIQPVIVAETGKFKMLNLDYETLMSPLQAQNRAFSFNFFKKNLRR